MTHRDGSIESSPQALIGLMGGSGVTFRGRLGKSRRQNDGSWGREGSYGPHAYAPKTFPRQTAVTPRHGDSAAAPPNRAKIWTAAFQRRSLLTAGQARRRALHPPRRLMPKPYHGCHAKLPCRPGPAPSPAHYSATSGVLHLSPSCFSLARPCDYRRIGRASHTSSPATPCLSLLGPGATHAGKWTHCPRTRLPC